MHELDMIHGQTKGNFECVLLQNFCIDGRRVKFGICVLLDIDFHNLSDLITLILSVTSMTNVRKSNKNFVVTTQ